MFISKDLETILEKREGNGIWQNLYQFPLIETEKNITELQKKLEVLSVSNVTLE